MWIMWFSEYFCLHIVPRLAFYLISILLLSYVLVKRTRWVDSKIQTSPTVILVELRQIPPCLEIKILGFFPTSLRYFGHENVEWLDCHDNIQPTPPSGGGGGGGLLPVHSRITRSGKCDFVLIEAKVMVEPLALRKGRNAGAPAVFYWNRCGWLDGQGWPKWFSFSFQQIDWTARRW